MIGCENCVHEGREYHRFPCSECIRVGNGDEEYFVAKASTIKDSGERRTFETGAVRDIQEGKGRCDLLPLDVVGELLSDYIIDQIAAFQKEQDVDSLFNALRAFSTEFKSDSSMILELAVHFEEGAKKYGEYNWQKGIPVHCYIDSAVRHYLKWMRGDTDERHDRAFVWNTLCCIWTMKNKPELNDLRTVNEK